MRLSITIEQFLTQKSKILSFPLMFKNIGRNDNFQLTEYMIVAPEKYAYLEILPNCTEVLFILACMHHVLLPLNYLNFSNNVS